LRVFLINRIFNIGNNTKQIEKRFIREEENESKTNTKKAKKISLLSGKRKDFIAMI